MSELADLSLHGLSAEIRDRRVSAVEAVEACLQRIRQRDSELNCFITLTDSAALSRARELDEELARGHYRGPLHGVPIGVKDLYQTEGVRTTAGSRILADWIPDKDAEVVRRLRDAGAVILGKLGTHEFAFGATGVNPHYGSARNPHDPARMTGGSSSGSAAAVASGMCCAALGSDTGGSIRCPAALCGIVGLKPTYDLLPRDGVVPLSWSLDHVGPMTRTVADAALMLQGMSGAGSPPLEQPDARLAGLRLGVPEEWFWDAIQPGVSAAVLAAVRALEDAGARVERLSLPSLEYAHAAQWLILSAEATTYHRPYLRTRADEYGPNVRSRLLHGLFIDAADYLDAQRARRKVRREFLRAFERVDALVTPAVPIIAPRFDEPLVRAGDYEGPPQAFLVRNTFPFNLVGFPAISIPCGRSEGLPVGLQLAAAPHAEGALLRLAGAAEALLDSR